MNKTKTIFQCQNCGVKSPKWIGKCNACGAWNSFVEEVMLRLDKRSIYNLSPSKNEKNKVKRITEIKSDTTFRIEFQDREINRVLGGGIVPGSIVLIGGEPGIGKSTLLLQLALQIKDKTVLYISGEESEQQIKMRANRLYMENENCFIYNEIRTEKIFQTLKSLLPNIVIIDSIQTLYTDYIESLPGSISQIRECTAQLIKYAKTNQVSIFLVGHITKDGNIAGPKVLEHMVDTVLQFEGERNHIFRILRSVKNRFGSTNEIGIYEMQGYGLVEVENPSEILISNKDKSLTGSAIASTMEGIRPLMIEVQALVSSAVYGMPQRSTTGFDVRRLNMLLAVLEKKCGFKLGIKDVFLNITGGIQVKDPAIDLAIAVAILSSNEDVPILPNFCFAAEIGLSGEIRPVNKIEQRIKEAEKLGFKKIFISSYNIKKIDISIFNIEIYHTKKVNDIFQNLFV